MTDISCWESKFESCIYSDKLLNKLISLDKHGSHKINLIEVKKAIYYARKYHGNQKRQSGEPYYSHPIEVAYQIADYAFKTDVLVTSILHDTLEDTKLTKEMIGCIFGSTVANNVEDLTRVKTDQKISAAETMKSLYLQSKNDLLLIKIFDRLHNMQTISAKSPEKIEKITEETLKEFIIIIMSLGRIVPKILEIEKKIIKLCYRHLFIKQHLQQDLKMIYEDNFQLFFPNVQNGEDLKSTLCLMG
ncbi:MAG: HD domain-containing protein [Gammaproteobacteria bacterium]